MSKVEELRAHIMQMAVEPSAVAEVTFNLDSLIAAAEEEGCEDGWVATKMLWQRMQKWNEEWQKENPKERSMTLVDAMDLIEWKIAAAREEGRAEERERIRKAADHYQAEDECFAAQLVDGNYVGASYEMYVVSPSLLASAPKEESK